MVGSESTIAVRPSDGSAGILVPTGSDPDSEKGGVSSENHSGFSVGALSPGRALLSWWESFRDRKLKPTPAATEAPSGNQLPPVTMLTREGLVLEKCKDSPFYTLK